MDEEEQNEINKKKQFNIELNKTAVRMKELAEEYKQLVDKSNIETLNLEKQKQIIEVANSMEGLMEGQKLIISNLLGNKKEEEELGIESGTESTCES